MSLVVAGSARGVAPMVAAFPRPVVDVGQLGFMNLQLPGLHLQSCRDIWPSRLPRRPGRALVAYQ
jgi:hypothetical protein